MSFYRVKVGVAEESHNLGNSPLPCTASPHSSSNQISNRRVHFGRWRRSLSGFGALRLGWARALSKTGLSLSTPSAHSGSRRKSPPSQLRPRMAGRARSALFHRISWPWRFDPSVGLEALVALAPQHSSTRKLC